MAYRTTEVFTCVVYFVSQRDVLRAHFVSWIESKIYYLWETRAVSASHGLKNEYIYHALYRACFKERVYEPRLACLLRFMTKKNEVNT